MTDDGPRPARDALGGATGAFADVLSRARRLARLQRRLESIASIVPPAGVPGLRVCGLRDGELRLLVPSATAATQLRFRERELTEALSREAGVPIRSLALRVRPPGSAPAPEPAVEAERGVPRGAAELLGALAASETDPALRRALARLAGRSR
ncbi:MAG: DciA family protein [Pseudomonadales bacterium]|jgi:hypothetical protein|nr:DciA family protein [Pseudomonadales bacterium]